MSKNTTTRKNQSAKARAFAAQGFTPLELERDYPGFGKRGDVFGLSPITADECALDDLVAVRVGDDVMLGHLYPVNDEQIGLASPVVMKRDDVKVLGRIAAV
jgi:hypothetical protein